MKVFFYSVKGGQGKTTHAIGYAKYKDALYLTNDFESGTIEIYQDMFSENQLQVIRPENEFNVSALKDFDDVVFDFGGWVDNRIQIIAQMVDVIVIPVTYQSIADLMPCIKTAESLEQHNKNIIILINNTDTKDIKELKAKLEKRFSEKKVFLVNRSKYINRLANDGKTIFELSKQGGIINFTLNKSGLIQQINKFYKYLDTF